MVKGMLGAAQKVTGEMMLVVAWYREDGAVLDISHVEKNIEPRGKMPRLSFSAAM